MLHFYRGLIFILTGLGFTSCNNEDNLLNSKKQQIELKNTFAACFSNIDTINAGVTIGCTASNYKLINDKYLIHILQNFPVQYDSCCSIIIDSSNGMVQAELLIFDGNNAHLNNLCTDVIITNYPHPTRKVKAQSGHLIIGFGDPTELYGNRTYRTSILIKKLVFFDRDTGEKIELKNELLWKVLNVGTPG